MPIYLIQAEQTAQTWSRLIANPEDRAEVARDGAGVHEGTSLGYWYAMGSWDVYSVIEAPSDVAATGLLCAMSASGAFTRIKTTPLLTTAQMRDALQRASTMPYLPPGAAR